MSDLKEERETRETLLIGLLAMTKGYQRDKILQNYIAKFGPVTEETGEIIKEIYNE